MDKQIDSITCVLAEVLGIFSEPEDIFLELKDKIYQDLEWIQEKLFKIKRGLLK